MNDRIANTIYDLLTGAEADITDLPIVENMFADEQVCDKLYNTVYEANLRLCERLNIQEDPDVELIINSLLRISRLLGLKMFQYGMKYQTGELTYRG